MFSFLKQTTYGIIAKYYLVFTKVQKPAEHQNNLDLLFIELEKFQNNASGKNLPETFLTK